MNAKFLLLCSLLAISAMSHAETVINDHSQDQQLSVIEIPCDFLVPRFVVLRNSTEDQAHILESESRYNKNNCEQSTGISFKEAFAKNLVEALNIQQMIAPRGEMFFQRKFQRK